MYDGIKTEFELLCTRYLQMQVYMKAASMSLKNGHCSKYTQVQFFRSKFVCQKVRILLTKIKTNRNQQGYEQLL